VQSTQVGCSCDRADVLDRAAEGRVLAKSEMRVDIIVVALVVEEHAAQVCLVEDDQMIETVATDRSDQSFHASMLPWIARRNRPISDAHQLDAAPKHLAVAAVAISDEKARSGVPRERVRDLRREPFRGRVAGHRE
jgi:hypothetical protein